MVDKKLLGLDIGSNSVGSAWVDTQKKLIKMGVSVFPAGVEDKGKERGAPKNQSRRSKRQQRRSINRKAILKVKLRQYLNSKGWIPVKEKELQKWERLNPWILRRDALNRELTEYEFGRILLHLAQKRGAWFFDEEPEDKEGSKKKKKDPVQIPGTVEYTKQKIKEQGLKTYGELIALEYEKRKLDTGKNNKQRNCRVLNRNNAFGDKVSEFVADRHMILDEFEQIWKTQKDFADTKLSKQLTDECKQEICNKEKEDIWRCQGALFSQRKAYWDTGTLGRCDLEPTALKCPKADMYAQEFLALTSINNIRITPPGEAIRPLEKHERIKVVNAVRKQKTASEATIRKALNLHKGEKKTLYTLNTDGDKFTVNGDWFYSQIVCGVFGENTWSSFDDDKKESINRAILKFDPADDTDKSRLENGCKDWWELNEEQIQKLMESWGKRPKKDSRVNLSRRAIKNLLPYLRDGYSVTEARNMFAEDVDNEADETTRNRYSTKHIVVNKHIRHFQKKHPGLLPPVSDGISNPVVRKSIHEVRRHILEHINIFDKPDRVFVELAREARQTAKIISDRMKKNKAIEELRKEIIETHNLNAPDVTPTQRQAVIKRVRLCRQQRYACAYSGLNEDKQQYACAYSGRPISEKQAAEGTGLEIDHIVPRSKGGDNSMSNLVLCYSTTNQGKGNKTPYDWLSSEDFGHLEQRFEHLSHNIKDKTNINKDNVDMIDNAKWKNLHRKTPREGFTEDQLRSSAYAATQTTDWINKVLYGSDDNSKRYVFPSKGTYTGILRRDWGLYFDEDGNRSEMGSKNRGDHRHHAIDALIIAMTTPNRMQEIKDSFIDFERQKEELKEKGITDVEAKWRTIEQPWKGFSEQVAQEYKRIIVSHKPQRRKLVLALHNDSLYGPAYDENSNRQEGYVVKSIAVGELKPGHLRVPEGWEKKRKELINQLTKKQKSRIRKEMLDLPDVKPATTGIVKDRWLREEIRQCLRENDLNPDKFTKAELKKLIEDGKLVMTGGNPIRKVRLLWAWDTLPPIKRKKYDFDKKEYVTDENLKAQRYYKPDKNHHIEIRENKKGNWKGESVTIYEAARRNAERLKALKEAGVPSVEEFRELKREKTEQYQKMRDRYKPVMSKINSEKSIVDRSDKDGCKFIMSLCIGDTVHMAHPEKEGVIDYFAVFKMSGNTISLTPHYSTGMAQPKEESKRKKNQAYRQEYNVPVSKLQKLIVKNKDGIPEKVRISPLGQIKVLIND